MGSPTKADLQSSPVLAVPACTHMYPCPAHALVRSLACPPALHSQTHYAACCLNPASAAIPRHPAAWSSLFLCCTFFARCMRDEHPAAPTSRWSLVYLAEPPTVAVLCVYCSKDGRPLPTIEVEFHNLRIEADALVGSAGNPSVLNSALSVLRTVTCQRPPTTPHTILAGVSGVLKLGVCRVAGGPGGGPGLGNAGDGGSTCKSCVYWSESIEGAGDGVCVHGQGQGRALCGQMECLVGWQTCAEPLPLPCVHPSSVPALLPTRRGALPCLPWHSAGRMTLLLGPPSGGKSVLLQALSGRLRTSRNLRVRNGRPVVGGDMHVPSGEGFATQCCCRYACVVELSVQSSL